MRQHKERVLRGPMTKRKVINAFNRLVWSACQYSESPHNLDRRDAFIRDKAFFLAVIDALFGEGAA